MARERKPLIEPGSVLPSTDTLARILERDRALSGRKPPAESVDGAPAKPEEMPPESSGISDQSDITSNITAQEDANITALKRRQKATKAEAQLIQKKEAQAERRTAALKQARHLAATRPIPITLRLPEGLNDWLDDYAHAHRKQGVKKQDLISRAVQLLLIELTVTDMLPHADGEDT